MRQRKNKRRENLQIRIDPDVELVLLKAARSSGRTTPKEANRCLRGALGLPLKNS